jgi:hypothetical protein
MNPNRGHYDPPPTVTHSTGPRAEVDRVDALSCEAPAVERVGHHCVCAEHQQEVRLAYWGTDANLILHKMLPEEYFQCGDVYTAAVTR